MAIVPHQPLRRVLRPVMFALAVALSAAAAAEDARVEQVDVFTGGTEGYHTYRIPAVVLTRDNTLLAFCEGRKTGRGDHGDLDLVLRRSRDGGRTWQPMQLVYEEGGTAKITIGNPCPVVDRTTGTIWLPFCRDNDRVFVTKSDDDGQTWAKPVEITADVKKPEWGWFATGPGHGIQLRSGRLVVPCDCRAEKGRDQWNEKGHSLVIYSDDHGKTWRRGGLTEKAMNECEVVELADGSLLLSMRNYLGKNRRALATSADAGLTWSPPKVHDEIFCPTCQSSIERLPAAGKGAVLYSGPGGPGRRNMTVRLSRDGGKTWPVAKVLYAGTAAYSDLVVLPDGTIGCLFERDDYGKITFSRFPLAWLTGECRAPAPAAAAPAEASAVNDEAKFFSAEAIEKANQRIAQIYADYAKTSVRIDTVPAVPAELKDKLKELGPEKFFPFWASKRAKDAKLVGVYVLLCRQPGHLQVDVDKLTHKKAFTPADLEQLVAVMSAQLRQKDYDAALTEGVDFVRSALENNLGKPKAAKKKR